MEYNGKKALVCGMARSGIAAAKLLNRLGARVTLQDMKKREEISADVLALEGEGIVLIDELDLHMHPAWQRKILSVLRKLFPNIQFLITTHSPQILGEVDRSYNLFMLEKNADGDLVGGPMYYIKNGLGKRWMWLAYLFAAFGVLTVFGTGNATQVNTITTAINSALIDFHVISNDAVSTSNLIIGIVMAVLVALILLGGVKRIGQVTEKLVPFMALLYIVLAVGVIVINIRTIPTVFASIFEGAFKPSAVTGGIVGSMFTSMKKGVSRGIFSNEAGLGTGSIAHACADTKKPVKQGMFGIFEVFTDTIVICTLTALVILCSGTTIEYGAAAGAELTISGFTSVYGSWVSIFTAIAMCCFAFSTILGWGLYGARCIEFLFSEKVIKPFMVAYSLVAILGATANLGLMWSIAETFNGLMAIPNLIALFLLSGTVVRLTKEYFATEGAK